MMSEGYRVVCPFCQTEVRGPHGGVYREFVRAVKAIKIHLRTCTGGWDIHMGKKEKDVIAENSVTVVESR